MAERKMLLDHVVIAKEGGVGGREAAKGKGARRAKGAKGQSDDSALTISELQAMLNYGLKTLTSKVKKEASCEPSGDVCNHAMFVFDHVLRYVFMFLLLYLISVDSAIAMLMFLYSLFVTPSPHASVCMRMCARVGVVACENR